MIDLIVVVELIDLIVVVARLIVTGRVEEGVEGEVEERRGGRRGE